MKFRLASTEGAAGLALIMEDRGGDGQPLEISINPRVDLVEWSGGGEPHFGMHGGEPTKALAVALLALVLGDEKAVTDCERFAGWLENRPPLTFTFTDREILAWADGAGQIARVTGGAVDPSAATIEKYKEWGK